MALDPPGARSCTNQEQKDGSGPKGTYYLSRRQETTDGTRRVQGN